MFLIWRGWLEEFPMAKAEHPPSLLASSTAKSRWPLGSGLTQLGFPPPGTGPPTRRSRPSSWNSYVKIAVSVPTKTSGPRVAPFALLPPPTTATRRQQRLASCRRPKTRIAPTTRCNGHFVAAGSSGSAGKVRSKDNNPMTDPATNKVLALRKRAEEEEGRTPIGIAGPQAQRTAAGLRARLPLLLRAA